LSMMLTLTLAPTFNNNMSDPTRMDFPEIANNKYFAKYYCQVFSKQQQKTKI
jgi:hypothetical protein